MKQKKLIIYCKTLIALVTAIHLTSCEKDEVKQTALTKEHDLYAQECETKLGKQLENPYTVENMRKAYENLNKETKLKSSVSINATHYYVRFFPKTDEELGLLEADSLILFDYPLDFEIEEIGEFYNDPDVNPEDGQWYYTSVSVDYSFPDIEYEILADLFLPETEEEYDVQTKSLKSASEFEFLCELEDEALRITGNYTEADETVGSTLKASKKRPHGYVKVYDTERKDFVPVEGVRVRTRRWFSYGYDYTDSKGYYSVSRRYRRDVHYCLFFKNSSGFKIRAGVMSLWKAKHHVGKHNRSGYDFNVSQNSRAWRFCTVNNAVVKYRRYCDQLGIGKPHSNLRIVASDRSGGGAAPMLKHVWGLHGFTSKSWIVRFLGKIAGLPATLLGNTFFKFVLPDIIIKANSSQGTATVYKVTFHELAHASHFKKVGNVYWSKYINYIVTYGAYGDGKGHNAGYCGVGEMWGNYIGAYFEKKEYSRTNWNGLYHGEDWYNPGFLRYVDDISDVTTSEIFSCMTSSTNTIEKMVEKLKTKTEYDEKVDNAYSRFSDWP